MTSTSTVMPSEPDTAAVRAATALARRLAGQASRLERDGVTRADLQPLADAGLYALFGPPELGGVSPPEQRRVHELLAGASPDGWFVWYQHGPVVKFLTASDNAALRDAYLPDLCAGRRLGGVAWSNLRTARPSVLATRVDGGWRLPGPQPFCTGWGLCELWLVGGLAPESGEVVFGIVPAGCPELRSQGELALAAMSGTSTHAIRYDALLLPDDAVVLRKDFATWAQADATANQNVQPSTFGVALAALDLLEPAASSAAHVLRGRVLDVRAQAYQLLDDVEPTEAGEQRLALRAEALLLGLECCTALLTSRGGRGIGLDDPAQLLLRAAAFQLVHSQAAHIRAATLEALAA